MTTIRRRLTGIAATGLLLALVIGAPLVLLAIGARPWATDFSELRLLLFSPDDGHLALLVINTVAWIAWAITALSITLEVLARARGIKAPRLPGLWIPQEAVGRLVAIAALAFTISPVAAPVIAPVAAHGTPHEEAHGDRADLVPQQRTGTPDSDEQDADAPGVNGHAHGATHPPHGGTHGETHGVEGRTHGASADAVATKVERARGDLASDYTVRRGDSLWRIAERHLGAGTRFTEIVDLNTDVLKGRADFLTPGMVLRLPADAEEALPVLSPVQEQTHVVEAGDTLWDIAEEHMGDPERYPEIAKASAPTVQDDGQRLTDPDLIQPGWRLTIPTQNIAEHERERAVPEKLAGDRLLAVPDPVPRTAPDPLEPAAPATQSSAPTVEPDAQAVTKDPTDEDSSLTPWLVPGLLGAGGLLAGGLLLRVAAHKRTQQRHRRPGFVIAPPPPEVRDVEKTITVTAPPAADALTTLNRLLSHLASVAQTLPTVDAVEFSHHDVTLHLREPSLPIGPWAGTSTVWTCALDTDVDDVDEIPPYPLLVSVGRTTDGHLWLLNLERPEGVILTGDLDRARALVRHIAAELVLNPWATINWIHLVDTSPELEALGEGRLAHHAPDDLEFLNWLHQTIDCDGDPEVFTAVVTHRSLTSPEVDAFAAAVKTAPGRTGATVITINDADTVESSALVLDLTLDGHLHVPHLDLTLAAAGLTDNEATACAAIVDLTRSATNVPVPVDDHATGVRALADNAGALRGDLTEPRPTIGESGPQSLLPDSSEAYVEAGATTSEDLDALSPVAPVQLRRRVEDADPDLDCDVADWFNPDCPVPRLRLMGPVGLRVPSDTPDAIDRRAFYTELVAYLALHPVGLSGQRLSDVFEVSGGRMRSDLGLLRTWLGTNPSTGGLHLPMASSTSTRDGQPIKGYRVEGILVDHDLFTRLRTRGQARGADGMDDLVQALELVHGRPFSNLRDHGWHWLLDDERTQDIALIAVVDVAHIVTTHALEREDLALARAVAEKACTIAPEFDSCQLDLARVLEAQGLQVKARELVMQEVHNRSDDGRGPIDLPPRTATLSRRRA